MSYALFDLPWWGYALVALGFTHVTIAAVTIFLHRCQAHRALDLHPAVSHFFRLWLWLTTGTDTKEWVAVHRKHHAKVETEEDPHSPQILGIKALLLEGREIYVRSAHDRTIQDRYGHGTPDDWLERNLYRPHTNVGLGTMLIANVVMFGPIGITIWAVQMLWIPIFAAGVINGIGHYWGYRNFETADASTNIVPWGIVVGGEELHNNHHAFPSSAKLSVRLWEFDIGWLYLRVLSALGLARIKRLPPRAVMVPGKALPDADTVKAVIANRLHVMSDYGKQVLARVHAEEVRSADARSRGALRRVRRLLLRDESRLTADARRRLDDALDNSQTLATVYRYRQQLQQIWLERQASHERLVQALQEWCHQAEATGIKALQDFARALPRYSLPATV